jgi:hypothetical protein
MSLLNGEASLALTPMIGLGILMLLSLWWMLMRGQVLKHPRALTVLSILFTLLASPYLLNYDFVLLLIPFFFLAAESHTPLEWLFISAALLIPLVAVGLFGRGGNFSFLISTAILLLIMYRHTRQLDVSSPQAYNPFILR